MVCQTTQTCESADGRLRGRVRGVRRHFLTNFNIISSQHVSQADLIRPSDMMADAFDFDQCALDTRQAEVGWESERNDNQPEAIDSDDQPVIDILALLQSGSVLSRESSRTKQRQARSEVEESLRQLLNEQRRQDEQQSQAVCQDDEHRLSD